jgi:hypothetical protein
MQSWADEYAAKIRALIPTATRVEIQTLEYSATLTKVGFAAKLIDGSWITGEWELGG